MQPASCTPVDDQGGSSASIHHGPGEWRSPTRLDALFPHWSPGEYRVISAGRRPRGTSPRPRGGDPLLESDQSAAGTTRALDRTGRWPEATGATTGFWPNIGVMLSSTGRITDDRRERAPWDGCRRSTAGAWRSGRGPGWTRPRGGLAKRLGARAGVKGGTRLRSRSAAMGSPTSSVPKRRNHWNPSQRARRPRSRVAEGSRAIVECDSAAAFLERADAGVLTALQENVRDA